MPSLWGCFIRESASHAIECPSFSLPTVSIIKNAAGSKREVRQILNANGQSVRQLLVRAGIGTGADGCLYVCVPYVKGRRCSEKNIHFHQVSCALPRRSFVKVAEGLYVASPELTFVQMASVLEEGALCACGMELTGGYPLDAEFRPDGEVVYVRAPVTSQTLLAAYADRYQGRGGTNKARRVTRHLCDKSASVKETELALLALLPRHYGGLGAKEALLNEVVTLSPEAATIARPEESRLRP